MTKKQKKEILDKWDAFNKKVSQQGEPCQHERYCMWVNVLTEAIKDIYKLAKEGR